MDGEEEDAERRKFSDRLLILLLALASRFDFYAHHSRPAAPFAVLSLLDLNEGYDESTRLAGRFRREVGSLHYCLTRKHSHSLSRQGLLEEFHQMFLLVLAERVRHACRERSIDHAISSILPRVIAD